MERLQFVTHQGKKILVEDFTNLRTGPDFYESLNKAKALIAQQPPKSVLAVFDVTGTSFNNDTLNAVKEFTKANTPYIKAAAVVGITGLLQVALTAVSKFSGRDFVSFPTRAQAMEWLIKQ
jgi:hypothetical protein